MTSNSLIALARVLAASSLLVGCDLASPPPQRAAIWVLPGSTVDRLEFGVSRDSGTTVPVRVQGLAVSVCGGEAPVVWRLTLVEPVAPVPTRFAYGLVPSGYTNEVPAAALRAGCYRVRVTGGRGIATFTVDSAGRVIQVSQSS